MEMHIFTRDKHLKGPYSDTNQRSHQGIKRHRPEKEIYIHTSKRNHQGESDRASETGQSILTNTIHERATAGS